MSWHYQALLTNLDYKGTKIPILQVHEVYPNGFGYTIEGIKPKISWEKSCEETKEPDLKKMHEQLISELEMMLRDLKKYPPLDKREDQ